MYISHIHIYPIQLLSQKLAKIWQYFQPNYSYEVLVYPTEWKNDMGKFENQKRYVVKCNTLSDQI